ncbi:MAG: acyl--CoA ligase [Candidatus Methanomethylophilaceae archaeon]|nr:acyl--CoA ligase [Candidatus Methanomethylophilaceae archaeon]
MAQKVLDPKYTPWVPHYGNVRPFIDYPEVTMYEMVRRSSEQYPDKIAYEFMNDKVKYRTLIQQIDHCALCLVKEGVTADDSVLICMPNCPQAVVTLYAANKIGAIATMVHPLSAKGEIEFYIQNCECSVVLTLDMFYSNFPEIKDGMKLQKIIVSSIADGLSPFKAFMYKHVLDGRKDPKVDPSNRGVVFWKDMIKQDVTGVPEPVSPKTTYDGAVILYTGGTTGRSKGALLSNMSFNSTALGMTELSEIYGTGESIAAVMPIFHGFGLCTCVHLPFCIGITSILVPRFTPDSYSKLIVKKKINFIAGVPTLFEHMLRSKWLQNAKDLSFLRGIFCGGDTLAIEAKQRMDAFFAERKCPTFVREGFGCTECLTATSITPKDEQRPGSVGIPMPNDYYKITEPGTDTRVPYGTDGEICIAGPAVMNCYYNEPEETEQTLIQSDEDGLLWLHTGDIGMMDEDGFIYFKQRLKRMIITSGYNVYPSQIENILLNSGLVKESCVIGVPDPLRGSKVKAFVVPAPGVEGNTETMSKLRSYCRTQIARYALPREYEFMETLPRTKLNKIDYRQLEQMDAEKRASMPQKPVREHKPKREPRSKKQQ